MATLAQTSIQPEAIAVVAVLVVAFVALLGAGLALVRSRSRRRRRAEELAADRPDPSRFADHDARGLVVAADKALYERDGRTLASAAMAMHEHGHPEALPYLLHALRAAPAHQRDTLLEAAAEHPADELADHPLLAAALDDELLSTLRERLGMRGRLTRADAPHRGPR